MVGDGFANRKGVTAAVLAILTHLLILMMPSREESKPYRTTPLLSITLNNFEQVAAPKADVKSPKVDNKPAITPAVEESPFRETNPPTEHENLTDQQEQTRITENSLVFRQFMQAEILRDSRKNPNAAKTFSETFVPDFVAQERVDDTEYAQGPLGGGQYKVRKNGKIYCVLKMVPLTLDDQMHAFPAISKDCTPKKVFDPKLRETTLD
jgi:hypothetical protein